MTPSWSDLVDSLRRAGILVSCTEGEPAITGLSTDSRTIDGSEVFLAVPGSEMDGHGFVANALAAGAAAVVAERPSAEGKVAEAIVSDSHQAARLLAEVWYSRPADSLELIGVTGTNGKTTTTMLVRHLLNAGGDVGGIGTLGAFDGAGALVASTAGTLTTPGPIDLQATLAGLLQSGVDRVVMEASSHSLDQGRLGGLQFKAALFTNLSRDHLDYHGTMEAYRDAKLKLADMLALNGVAVVNMDDDAWSSVRSPRTVSFGLDPEADVRAANVVSGSFGSRFDLAGAFGTVAVDLPLLGGFNVHNAVAAAACALALEVEAATIAARLSEAPQVPGRMERIGDRPCPVLRDYAHTPDALERVLQALRPLVSGRIILVFGCGGDRDRGKRPIMGQIAYQLADIPVLTSDNPRTEDPSAILDDVEHGMPGGARLRFVDRREAIAAALAEAGPDDTVLLAGKGHETYQIVGTERFDFDEAAIVRRLTGQ